MPTASDLVTDLPADFEVFGQAVDTSLADLKGGTTGQVLSKATNADMDFTWVTSDDANAIQNAIVDAKGDLIAASAADTPARLAVGNNGETLVADSSASTGLRYQGNFAAAKNKIINGDFTINQRNFVSTSSLDGTFCFDRWKCLTPGDGTNTFSPQVFTPGAAPISGYEATNYLRMTSTGQTTAASRTTINQPIEDVRTFAGQTVTLSFFAKASTGTPNVAVELTQVFGSGGSATITGIGGTKLAITSSWVRYSVTISVPSISGKTIGTSSSLGVNFYTSAGSDYNARTQSLGLQSVTVDVWGLQLEAGAVATAFQTATGTIQGELSACQRYYVRYAPSANNYAYFGNGTINSSTNAYITLPLPVEMRVIPTSIDTTTAVDYRLQYGSTAFNVSSLTLGTIGNGTKIGCLSASVASGLTTNGFVQLLGNNNSTAFVGFSAEL